MENAIKSHVKLSPLDVEKAIVMYTDAAPTVGITYILRQVKALTMRSQESTLSTVIQILLKRVNVQKGTYNYLHEFFIFNLNVTKKK